MPKTERSVGDAHHTSNSEQGRQQVPTNLCHEERKHAAISLLALKFPKQPRPKFSPQSSAQRSRLLQEGPVAKVLLLLRCVTQASVLNSQCVKSQVLKP